MNIFTEKVGLVQRVLPNYRAPFFNALGRSCIEGLSVFAGEPRPEEMIKPAQELDHAQLTIGKNIHLLKNRFYLCIQVGLIDWLADWDPEVLILEANPRYLSSPAAIRWMHERKRPVIGWGLGAPSIPDGLLAGLRQKRRKHFIHQFDSLITYSQTGAAEYAQLGFPEERIFVAVNAVTPRPEHPMPFRPVPKPDTKIRVLFVGRLQERKNIDNLILACSKLPDSLQPELVIVGNGPARETLTDLAQRHYIMTNFTGALYGDDLSKEFEKADLFVLPGTGGLAIQQAMSYGLPIIAAEADGTQTDLVRPENGWQVPPNDIQALRDTLEAALIDIERLRKKGQQSYRIISEEINLDQMVAVFIKALNRSIS
jgi:glycosyltransferase involved in cell wall biosynthesis